MNDVIFDLDDQAPGDRDAIPHLLKLKSQFPKLKVTLFAVPYWKSESQKNFLEGIKNDFGDWIQLAIHGWKHDSNFEFSKHDYETAKKYIEKALAMDVFVKGFKAPGWQISRDAYQVCKDLGLWVADHKISIYTEAVPNEKRRPTGLKVYEIDHPWMVHGHTWECENNGIESLIKHGLPFDHNTKFHFIEEVV